MAFFFFKFFNFIYKQYKNNQIMKKAPPFKKSKKAKLLYHSKIF